MTKSKAEQLRERAAVRAAHSASNQTPAPDDLDQAPVEPGEVPAPDNPPRSRPPAARVGQTIRVKPVKVTVELQPVEHQGLMRSTQRFAEELQLPRIAGAEVFRVLLDLMQHDEDLAERVGQELARTGGTRRR
jgi:hypothetical protein